MLPAIVILDRAYKKEVGSVVWCLCAYIALLRCASVFFTVERILISILELDVALNSLRLT